jgi:hypothetical protein
MDSNFVINNGDEKFDFFIFSMSYMNPINGDDLSKMEIELNELSSKPCTVLFDLFLSMGNASNRYIKAIFNGVNFEIKSFIEEKIDKKDIIREKSMNFYKEHKDVLSNSVLSNQQQLLILRGVSI